MRFFISIAAAAGRATLSRASSMCPRVIPSLLIVMLGLGGLAPCLCSAEPARNAVDPHACCGHATSGGRGAIRSAAVSPCVPPCAGNHDILVIATPLRGVQDSNAAPLAEAPALGTRRSHEVPAAPLAFAAPDPSPPFRTSVLRI